MSMSILSTILFKLILFIYLLAHCQWQGKVNEKFKMQQFKFNNLKVKTSKTVTTKLNFLIILLKSYVEVESVMNLGSL